MDNKQKPTESPVKPPPVNEPQIQRPKEEAKPLAQSALNSNIG